MKNTERLKLTCAMLLMIGSGTGAMASVSAPFMETTGKTTQPIGHYEFCQSHAAECAVKTKGDPRVHLTAALWNQLVGSQQCRQQGHQADDGHGALRRT